ncbi:TVP38/TMEM64 family protein [Paenibacillus medicaginis]|uniref:TVP38/TMEM64 family membrane protein n=1 Tax=Paenibacillus medicaginis TaxID=1470560 RepID=A0ABV5C974_9BACL
MLKNKVFIGRIINLFSIIGLIGTILFCVYGYQAGIFTSSNKMQLFVEGTGIWGPLIFVLIQIIQVVLPVLPGGISCAYGVILFGPVYGFIYNYVGIIIGSIFAFLIARQYGKPFIQKITPARIYHKYSSWLDKGNWFDKLFALGIFLPGAPDDFLCMLAGITKMKLGRFILILIVCKPAALFVYSMGLSTAMGWLGTYF